MNINKSIINGIRSQLRDYDCSYEDTKDLLFNGKNFLKKQEIAMRIIKKAMGSHNKGELTGPLHKLAKIEPGVREAVPWLRDHVVHATLSFFLGIYINENFFNSRVDTFQWELAGMLHDIGYSAEIASDFLKDFEDKINEFKEEYRNYTTLSFNIRPENLINLPGDRNALDLIQGCLDKWELKINAKDDYEKMVNSGEIDHGIISSLSLLNAIDALYQRHTNPDNFNYYIIPACSAIFIHNLKEDNFKQSHINIEKAPLAFLLKLSDCLQEWGRPSLENPEGIPATSFDIMVKNGKLLFIAEIPNNKIEKIKNEIESTLDDPKIEIRSKFKSKSYKIEVNV